MSQAETPGDAVAPQAEEDGLRVLFLSDAFPERNGTGSYYPDLLAGLGERLTATELIQPDPRKGYTLPLPGDATQRLAVPSWSRVRKAMARVQPHIVLVATPGPYGLMGAWAAQRAGSVLLSGYHTDFVGLLSHYWGPVRRLLLGRPLRAVQRWLLQRSEAVIINAGDTRGSVEELGARHIEVLGTPLPRTLFETPAPEPPSRIKRVCFIGRLAPEKNVRAVVEAARTWPDLQVMIAGEGPLRAELEAAAAALPNLTLQGWLAREGVQELLDASDLLVLPSHAERFGSAALEAMARARPALVSAVAGIHDWPELSPGLFRLEPEESVSDALGRLQALSAQAVAESGNEALSAARAFHQRTIEAWLQTLHRYKGNASCER